MKKDKSKSDDTKVVFVHGFSQEEVSRIMRGVRSVVADPGSVAFCMSTEKNVEWKVKSLIIKRKPPASPVRLEKAMPCKA